jgi:hypothetical protein
MIVLSTKLVRMIESHAEQITGEAIRRVREDPKREHLRKLPESELRNWAGHILQHLGDWLAANDCHRRRSR